MPNWVKHPAVRFLLNGVFLYGIWLLHYYLFIKKFTNWDYNLNYSIVYLAHEFFNLFGQTTVIEIESDHIILMTDSFKNSGVWVGDECNGFKLFSIFSIFIIAYPGPWKTKVWFILMGIAIIHLANVLRVMALLLIYENYPTALDFNHLYTFTILVYSIIFILWWIWSKKYGTNALKKN